MLPRIRRRTGRAVFELGGADAIIFTGGHRREQASTARPCVRDGRDRDRIGPALNASAKESRISRDDSRTQLWIVPTNEELVVARQTKEVLGKVSCLSPEVTGSLVSTQKVASMKGFKLLVAEPYRVEATSATAW
jgi:hypothetical protein